MKTNPHGLVSQLLWKADELQKGAESPCHEAVGLVACMDHTDSSEQLSAESLRCPEVRGRSLQEQGMEHYPHTCLPLSLTLGNRSRLVSVELCLTIARKACSLLLGLLSPLSTLKLAQEQKLLKKLTHGSYPCECRSFWFYGNGPLWGSTVAQQWWASAASDRVPFSAPSISSLPFSSSAVCYLFSTPSFYSFNTFLPLLTLIPLCL